ncbi:hypothetical protein [Streptomyces sp. NPDC001820]|uniref:hypothetical protein n=1 Tax=Streptomyces sp. NPDC001820 TaxID=3364613 RepID=UPI003674E8EC
MISSRILRKVGLIAATCGALVATSVVTAPSAAAAAAPCGSLRQLGATAYAKFNGETVASVKQFYGCGKNYGYIYVWESFRANHPSLRWQIYIGISHRDGHWDGYRQIVDTRTYELYSYGADTADVCTTATGGVIASAGGLAETAEVC